jgi:hypothetical protein
MGILLLMKKEAIRTPSDLNAKEVMKSSQILDGKLVTEPESKLLKESCRGGREDDVINIQEQVCSHVAMVIDKQRSVRASDTEAHSLQKAGDPLVPGARGLLEAIERPR